MSANNIHPAQSAEQISVIGARVNNLKNIDVDIPRNTLTVITGLSGSGKSSLAFDTIFAEGQRRYIDTFSAYARSFLGNLERTPALQSAPRPRYTISCVCCLHAQAKLSLT